MISSNVISPSVAMARNFRSSLTKCSVIYDTSDTVNNFDVFFIPEEKTNWILPLTAGGFIHIGLVTILPDLLRETNPVESFKQLCALLFGIVVMAALMFV